MVVVLRRTDLTVHDGSRQAVLTSREGLVPAPMLGEIVWFESHGASCNDGIVLDDKLQGAVDGVGIVDGPVNDPLHVVDGCLHVRYHVFDLEVPQFELSTGPLLHLVADAVASIKVLDGSGNLGKYCCRKQ